MFSRFQLSFNRNFYNLGHLHILMVPQVIIVGILEWLIEETMNESLLPGIEKAIMGDEFQRLGTQVLYDTIENNPEYKRILNILRERGNFEVLDATELNKEKICGMFSEKDRGICCEFLETLKTEYINKIREIADKNPLGKFQMRKIQEHDESISELKKHANEIVTSNTEVIYYQDIVEKALKTEYQVQLDHSRDLVENYRPREALKFLEDLKRRIWLTAEPIIKYEILKNMGAAKFSLNHEQEAGKLFLEALQYNPDDEKALCNAAFGYLLLHQLEEAKTFAGKVTAKNPANTRAYSITIQASSEKENIENIISRVPEPYRCDPEIAYAISHLARKREDLFESRKWLEISVENDRSDWPDPKGSLGERLLELVMKDQSVIYGAQISDEQKNQINRAIELLTQAWNRIADTDVRNLRSVWVADRGIAKRLLGDIKEATRDIDLALDIDLHPVYKRYKALLASEAGDNEEAIRLLREIQLEKETPEAPLLLAMVLRKENGSREAIDVISDLLRSNPSDQIEERANRMLIQLYVDIEDFKNARKISDSMRESDPRNILNLVAIAWILRIQNENTEALSILKEAEEYVTDSTSFEHMLGLAEEFYFLGQFEDAADIYERIVDATLNTSLTRQLLSSYYGAGEIGKAYRICQTLHQRYGPLEYVSEIEAAVHEEIGDLAEAKRVCQEYLGVYPDDFRMKLHMALLNAHSNNLEELDEFLGSQINIDALSLEHGFSLAKLYAARNSDKKALEIMYQMRRKYFNHSEAHLNYFFFFYAREQKNEEWLDPCRVCVDAAVLVEDSSGKTDWYIIVDQEDSDIHRREFNKDHQIARKLLGKSVGDEVLLIASGYSREVGKIVDIKSKYVQAFQEIQNSYEKQFPDKPGLWQIKWERPEKDGELPKNIEKMIRETSKKQIEISQKAERFYEEGKITIGAFACSTRRSVLEVWGGLMNNPELGIKCCLGTFEERNHALSLLNNNPRLIVDVISLMTLCGLGVGDAITKAFGKLGIAQSTVDFLRHITQERKGPPSRGYMTIGVEGENLVKQMVSAGEVEHNIEYMEGVLQWIKDNCEILPSKAALKIRRDKREKLENTFGKSFIDTILIGGEPGKMLYSDDILLRRFAKNDEQLQNFFKGTELEFNVDGVWTQVVLIYCLKNGFLDRNSYNKMIVKLVCSHYYFTSIDLGVLIEAVRQSNWEPSELFKTALRVLSGEDCDENSVIDLSVNFLFELWKEPISSASRDYLVLSLLDSVTTGRNQNEVLDRLLFCMRKKFSVLPLVERVVSLVRLWKELSE